MSTKRVRRRTCLIIGLLVAPITCRSPSSALVVSPKNGMIEPGATRQLVAVAWGTDSPLSPTGTTWDSRSPSVAMVSGSGVVRGLAVGTAWVVASRAGGRDSTKVTVQRVPTSVVIANASAPGMLSADVGITVRTAVTPGAMLLDINPGESIQGKVNANPAGTAFRIKAGTHRRQTIVPKSGNQFIGEPGAVLDGENTTEYAFHYGRGTASYPSNVRIRGLVITRYRTRPQFGAVTAGDSTGREGRDWVVEDNEISRNAGVAVRIASGMQLLRNSLHHNGQAGVSGVGHSVLVEGNEIAFNNPARAFDYEWEAGGAKFVLTDSLIVRDNHIHDNIGPGLWTDIENINTLYEGNRIENNADVGIYHEISYRATIRNNTIRGNGWDRLGRLMIWGRGAGILISASTNVDITGNIVAGNAQGITAFQQNRGSGRFGVHRLANILVWSNTIEMNVGGSGIAQDSSDPDLFAPARNIRFYENRYLLGTMPRYFHWNSAERTRLEWQAAGQDIGSTFNR